MTRVLLVCPEPLRHGQPAGIGIRFVEVDRVLRNDGHRVVLLTPDGQEDSSGTSHSSEGRGSMTTPSALTPANLLRFSNECDMAIVQGHVANDLFAHGRPIPTVVDLYDPFIIENLHYFETRGSEVFGHDHATLLNSLLRGDLFLCASAAQRLFYLGALLTLGRLNPLTFAEDKTLATLVRLAPFGVEPPRPTPRRSASDANVLFGGLYDWYDPILAIDAVAIARREIPNITLTFTRHPNPAITPQGKIAEAMIYAKQKHYDFVLFEPWVPYDRRGEFFDRFSMALLTFQQSLESELAMRTRIYDFLWAGLPIVTSSAPGTDEILERDHAGTVVLDDVNAFAAEIVSILSDRERYERMSAASRAFVTGHQWEETLQPLREFCRSPRIDVNKETFAAQLQAPAHRPSLIDRLRRRVGGSF